MPIPNFLLIGAQKCGTTALYQALQQHPDIYMSPNKEPFFFSMDGKLPAYRMPRPRYMNQLVYDWNVYQQLFAGVAGQRAIGEASAIYLSSYYPERTAERIYQRIPAVRLIALVRQPAERAYSAHTFYYARSLEPLADFAQALAAEPERVRCNEMPDLRHRLNGYYYANLKPYFDRFPRDQIRVYLYEDWKRTPLTILQDIFRFLGVDDTLAVTAPQANVTYCYRSRRLGHFLRNPNRLGRWLFRHLPVQVHQQLTCWNQRLPPPMPSAIRRELTAAYREDILQLQQLIGRDLRHWLD